MAAVIPQQPGALARRTTAKETRGILDGKQTIARGAERYALHLSLFVNVALMVALIWTNHYQYRMNSQLISQMHGGLVFEVSPAGTRAVPSTEYMTGFTPLDMRNRAWEIVKLVAGADSTQENNVYTNYAKARLIMTNDLRTEFDRTFLGEQETIAQANLKQLVQVMDPERDIRPITAAELPRGSSLENPGFHMIVIGRRTTLSATDGRQHLSQRFAYYINLMPDNEGRSMQNPTGLKVNGMVPVTVPDPMKQMKEKSDATSTDAMFHASKPEDKQTGDANGATQQGAASQTGGR